ncbi:MAG: amidohydrolase [candidate division NC10 bacterium]
MTKTLFVVFVLVLIGGCSTDQQSADVAYRNGRIYTVNETQPWAEAVAIKDGKFLVVGSTADVEAVTGNNTEVIDLDGKFVMPGIFDLHSHPFITPWYGSMNLELTDPGDREKTLQQVKAYAEANPDKEWILGGQWLLGTYPDDNPRKEWLDAVVTDRPVNLLDQTGHSSWLNSKALELAGITADTPTSNLVVIEKDPETGEPSGTIREQALQLAERVTPQASAEVYADVIDGIFDMYLSYGITSQQTAEGHQAPLEAMKFLEQNSRLHQRVFVSWDWKTTLNLAYTVEDIEEQIRNRSIYETDLVKPNWVKIFSDGGPNAGTSLLLEPYEGEPDNYGSANMSTEEFAEAFIKFDKMGVGLHVHSIGDGSIRRVVDALEMMKEANGDSGVKHKVAHNAMITPEDLQRLAAMKDVNIDFSPPVFYPHAGAAASFTPKVGEDRMQQTYPVKSALASGLHVGQGADWLTANPTPNPFWAIEGMVTRMNPFDPKMTGTLNPSEAITLEQALAVCTIEGAHVLGVEDNLGSIAQGKQADMIILDQNLFEIDEDQIGDTKVLQTILNGEVVFER